MREKRARQGTRVTRTDQVADDIRRRILAPGFSVGDRLPATGKLADEFNVSMRTVHLALERLEQDGYVIKRNGVGTFVTSRHRPVATRETVAVCMNSRGHMYGELWSLLMHALQERGLAPVGIDTSREDSQEWMSRLYHTEGQYYLVQLGDHFPFDLFQQPAFQRKPVIGFFGGRGEREWPGLYRVKTDLAAGAGLVAEYLWAQGWRRILLVGTHTDEYVLRSADGRPFVVAPNLVAAWESLGGKWTFFASETDMPTPSSIRFDEDRLMEIFRSPQAAQAVVGTRDVEVWEAQQVIRRRSPELADSLSFCGFFDTPWSRAGSPPFTTVSMDLPAMAAAAMDMLDALRAGREPPRRSVVIRPQLIPRD